MDSKLKRLGDIAWEVGMMAQEERENLSIEHKPDGSLVTAADRKVELALREKLPQLEARAGIWGEEFGYEAPGEAGLWTIDPIDGTTNFAHGSPMWGVGIALVNAAQVTYACIFLPDLDELYVGGKGKGVFLNGQRLPKVKPGPILDQDPVAFDLGVLKYVKSLPGKMRNSGSAVVDGAWTAAGRFRGIWGENEHFYDVGPGIGMMLELGFEVSHTDGTPFELVRWMEPNRIHPGWSAVPPAE